MTSEMSQAARGAFNDFCTVVGEAGEEAVPRVDVDRSLTVAPRQQVLLADGMRHQGVRVGLAARSEWHVISVVD